MTNAPVRVGVIRTRKIVANSLQIRGSVPIYHSLAAKVRRLRLEVRQLRREVHHNEQRFEHEIHELWEAIARLEEQIVSGEPTNPSLQALFSSKQGQVVTVGVASGTLAGTVTVVGTNAVELTESNQDVLIIPYSQITSVQ